MSKDALDIGIYYSNESPNDKAEAIKKLPNAEQPRQIALWTCTFGFEELVPELVPSDPIALRDWKKMNELGREKNRHLVDNDAMQKFINDKLCIIRKNKDNVEWLYQTFHSLDAEKDHRYREQIRKRVIEFKQFYDKDKTVKTRPAFKKLPDATPERTLYEGKERTQTASDEGSGEVTPK